MKYRSRSDIIGSILRSATQGSTKTRIMYSSYLSYAQVQEYLKFLIERGLLRHEPETSLYWLTEKGIHALTVLGEISELSGVQSGAEETVTAVPQVASDSGENK